MRVAVILLACVTALASAQYNNADVGGQSQRALPIPIRNARFQRPPPARSTGSAQPLFANQRIRRPIPFKQRGSGEDGQAIGPTAFPSGKPIRPGLPTAPAFIQHVKPVNEEPEEDDRPRDSGRERESHDDERDLSREREESEEESEENVSRAIANLGAVGATSISRGSTNLGGPVPTQSQPAPVQYRPYQGTPVPTGRGGAGAQPPPVQYRPSPKPTKPRKLVEETIQQQVKPPPKPAKPSQAYDIRGKKPVAQIIRRYRNDNTDGSITWGFENDDGSYKEELIGIDCITRGKYGYIDPDGIRREYTYETGIKCDQEQRDEDEENGFVDYQENKLVLPDGKTIDLSSMGKKQARRPGPIYGN